MVFALALIVSILTETDLVRAEDARPRLLVLTDIGGDPDDQQSLIRLMLYSNEFEIEGLIASAAGTPGELKEATVKPQLIREIVEAFGRVRAHLVQHADGYPSLEELRGRIKAGNPQRGLKAIGEDYDTEGSRWIIAAADKEDERPLNISIWGGQTDLAQALWRVRKDRGQDGLAKFLKKLRIYDISDQDGIQSWIHENFPGLLYVLAKAAPGRDKREGAYRGMYLDSDEKLTSRDWLNKHVRQDHGPLGALYPAATWTAPNPHGAMKEGDTPSWFFFLPHGLNDPAHPEWGGWGGRFVPTEKGLYRDASDKIGKTTSARNTVSRWRLAYQAEFRARMDWCVQPRDRANHPPIAVGNGDRTKQVLTLQAAAGAALALDARNLPTRMAINSLANGSSIPRPAATWGRRSWWMRRRSKRVCKYRPMPSARRSMWFSPFATPAPRRLLATGALSLKRNKRWPSFRDHNSRSCSHRERSLRQSAGSARRAVST
jgi:hypothetical protein